MADEDFTLYVMQPEAPPDGAKTTATTPSGEQLELHSFGGAVAGFFGWRAQPVPGERVLESWRSTQKALATMIADAEREPQPGFRLEELEVSLGISAEGTVMVATVKGEASIALKFKRS